MGRMGAANNSGPIWQNNCKCWSRDGELSSPSHHLPRFVPSLPSLCRPTGSAVRGRSTRFCDILEYWLVMATEELFANALVQKEKQNKK